STICGWYLSCRSCWTKRSKTASYIDSRGLFRGTGCGSKEVIVSGNAMVTTCFFWASAARCQAAAATPAAPAPVVRRNVRRLIAMMSPSLVVSQCAVHALWCHRQLGQADPDRVLDGVGHRRRDGDRPPLAQPLRPQPPPLL